MSGSHHLTHATNLSYGGAKNPKSGKYGITFAPVSAVDLGTPVGVDGDGLANDIQVTAAAPAVIAMDMDVPRNVTVTSSGDDSGISYLVDGQDEYGARVSELIAGANAGKAEGEKAFGRVETIRAVGGDAAGTVDVGWGRAFGLPYKLSAAGFILKFSADGEGEEPTVVVADEEKATPSTGDVRGTVNPATTPDGETRFILFAYFDPESSFGVGQA